MKQFSPVKVLLVLMLGVLLLTACGPTASETLTQTTSVTISPADNPAALITTSPDTDAASAEQTAAEAAPPADPFASLQAQQEAFVGIYEAANPAVVNISVGNGQGSGFVYSEEGHIITNNHVIEGAERIQATFADGTQREAVLVGSDPDSDLAVLKVDAEAGELTALALADSDDLRVGQIVIAIGNPFGQSNSMTTGIVSGLGRLLPSSQTTAGQNYNIPDIIQTDAAINPGNSGGPLLDLEGRVIGVNSAIASPVRGSSGVGYAVPSNIVSLVVPQLVESGRVEHPWIGIAGGTLTAEMAQTLGLDSDQRGVLVASVTPDSPAAAAQLKGNDVGRGDVIVKIEDRPVREFDDLLGYLVQRTRVGEEITLSILRDGQTLDVTLTLQARPSAG